MLPITPEELAKVPYETPNEKGVPEEHSGLEIVCCVTVIGTIVAMGLFFIGSKELGEFFKTLTKDILRQVLTPHF